MLGLRVSGIVLSKNWEESLFQEDTDANVIMLYVISNYSDMSFLYCWNNKLVEP